jgi:methyl-accepting chemotaxis protein
VPFASLARRSGASALLHAAEQDLAWIEFTPTANIVAMSDGFLDLFGYTRRELVGQHHRQFVLPDDAASAEYADLWRRLANGSAESGVFRRRAKDGRVCWLHRADTPIRNRSGRVHRVVKFTRDVTAAKTQRAQDRSRLDALDRSQASITFDLEGRILDASTNFLQAVGYAREEVVGQHHRLFMDPVDAATPAYAAFRSRLSPLVTSRGPSREASAAIRAPSPPWPPAHGSRRTACRRSTRPWARWTAPRRRTRRS